MPARASSLKSDRRRRCRDLPRMCSAIAAMWFRCSPIIPKFGDIPSFNQALCALYAAGLGRGQAEAAQVPAKPVASQSAIAAPANDTKPTPLAATAPSRCHSAVSAPSNGIRTTNSAVCSPMLWIGAAGNSPRREARLDRHPGDDHRSGFGTAGNRAHLRRCQHRTHPARRAIHRRDPYALSAGPCSTNTSRAW